MEKGCVAFPSLSFTLPKFNIPDETLESLDLHMPLEH